MHNRYSSKKLAEIEYLNSSILATDPANIDAGEVRGLVGRIRLLETLVIDMREILVKATTSNEISLQKACKALRKSLELVPDLK